MAVLNINCCFPIQLSYADFLWGALMLPLIQFNLQLDTISNGQLRFKGEYYNGYRHGTWTDWNGNGDTISIVNYDQGELSGSFKVWELEKSLGR